MGLLSSEDENVFAYLDAIRARPGMYIDASKDPLRELEALIHGYYGSLRAHGLIEPVPQMANHFSIWLYCQTRWSTSTGWAHAIASHSRSGEELANFFRYVDQFRKLKPIVRFALAGRRRTKSNPKGPSRIEIIRYAPTRLHFLRSWDRHKAQDGWILMDTHGRHETSLAFAKRAVIKAFPQLAPKLQARASRT
jgi:hypothetical protein